MINISETLSVDRVLCQQHISSKKKALEIISNLFRTPQHEHLNGLIFDALFKRERLGSTGLGSGIALPHGRISELDRPIAAFCTLSQGVDFDALDGKAVTMIFAIAMPEHCNQQHLQILAKLAEMFSDSAFCESLRQTQTASQLYRHLATWQPPAKSAYTTP